MKQKIISLGKRWGLDLHVIPNRMDFDIIDYEVYYNEEFVGIYRHYTGKTSNNVGYPAPNILNDIEKDIKTL